MITSAIQRYLAGFAYIFAGVYLISTKPTGYISWSGALSCIFIAIISFTKYKEWSILGGGILVAGSLFLQSMYSYHCIDCIRADIFILSGMILGLFFQRIRVKGILFSTFVVVFLFLAGNIVYHFDFRSIIGISATVPESASDNISREVLLDNNIKVFDDKGRVAKINISERPILLFSPFCSSCIKTLKLLGSVDPNGLRFFVAQTEGDLIEGKSLLRKFGYKGANYLFAGDWSNPVPAMLIKKNNDYSATLTYNLGLISKTLIGNQYSERN